mgnify:CR=1 FL=1
MRVDISASVSKLKLENPTILASGIMGISRASLRYVARNGAGAVTIKSLTKEPRKRASEPYCFNI